MLFERADAAVIRAARAQGLPEAALLRVAADRAFPGEGLPTGVPARLAVVREARQAASLDWAVAEIGAACLQSMQAVSMHSIPSDGP